MLQRVIQLRITVRNHHGLVVVIRDDGVGDAVEVRSVGGPYPSVKQGCHGDFHNGVAEHEDAVQVVLQRLQRGQNPRQVLIHAAGHIKVDGESLLFGCHPLDLVLVMKRRHTGGQQHEIPLRRVHGHGRNDRSPGLHFGFEPVNFASGRIASQKVSPQTQMRADGLDQEIMQLLRTPGALLSHVEHGGAQVFRQLRHGIRRHIHQGRRRGFTVLWRMISQ